MVSIIISQINHHGNSYLTIFTTGYIPNIQAESNMLESGGSNSSGNGMPENPNGAAPRNNILEFKSPNTASEAQGTEPGGKLLYLDRLPKARLVRSRVEILKATEPTNNVIEFPNKAEIEIPLPHVVLQLRPEQKIQGALLLHEDRPASHLVVEEEDGRISLPSGEEMWLSIDGIEFLIRDHTTSSENGQGMRGVSISVGRRMQHEVRTHKYVVDGKVEQVESHKYSMPVRHDTYLNEEQEANIAGVGILYDSGIRKGESPPEGVDSSTVAIIVGEDGMQRYMDGNVHNPGIPLAPGPYIGNRTEAFAGEEWVGIRDRMPNDPAFWNRVKRDRERAEREVWRKRLELNEPGLHVVRDHQNQEGPRARVASLHRGHGRKNDFHNAS
jgi:hypothetical protein